MLFAPKFRGGDVDLRTPSFGILCLSKTGLLSSQGTVQSIFFFCTAVMPFGLPRWLSGKESACQAGDMGAVPGSGGSHGGGHGNPLQYSCLEYCHGKRSLMGYSPWGHKELAVT